MRKGNLLGFPIESVEASEEGSQCPFSSATIVSRMAMLGGQCRDIGAADMRTIPSAKANRNKGVSVRDGLKNRKSSQTDQKNSSES